MNYFKQVILFVTKQCNLRCKYCYVFEGNWFSGSFNRLDKNICVSKEIIEYAIEKLNPKKATLQISGGEPFLYPEIVEYIVKKTKEKRPSTKIKIQTNGTLIDRKIASFIKNNKLSIGVSIDGKPEINDILRGKSKEVLEGMYTLKKNYIQVTITSVITTLNVECLDTLAAMALLFENVSSISFDLLRKPSNMQDMYPQLMPEKNMLFYGFSKAYSFLKKAGNKIMLLNDIATSNYLFKNSRYFVPFFCWSAMGESITVCPDGKVFCCPTLIYDDGSFLGYISDEIKYQKPLRNINKIKECSFCEAKIICRGGCPTRAYLEKGEKLGISDIECAYKKFIYENYINKN